MKVAAIALGFVVVASVLPVTQQAAVVSAQVSLAVHIEALSNVNRASEAMTRAAALAGLTLPSAPAPMPLSLSQALLEMYAQLGVPLTKADRARVQLEAARLPTEVQAAAGAILTTINHCDRQVKLAWSAVAPEDHAWFLEASALADPSEADAERMAAIAALVEMERVAACAKLLLETVEHQLPSIRAGFAQAQVRSSHGIRLMVVTHDGPLVVRSTCSDGGYGYAPWGEDLPGKLVRIGGPEDNCYVPQPDAVAPTGA
ncbi:MAG TPA: hypothetical protein VM681_00225, partial [Candidatus Thermoplasmatota archaeon]|nr:hypothetical protein [Candidatus Thermoplasmatota archaeon]